MSGTMYLAEKRLRQERHQEQMQKIETHEKQCRYESTYHLSSRSSVSKQSVSRQVAGMCTCTCGVKTSEKTSEKSSVKSAVKTSEKVLETTKLSSVSRKSKNTCLAMDTDLEVIGYVVPVFRANHEVVRSLAEAQDEVVKEEGVNYVAMRNLFLRESKESTHIRVEKTSRKTTIRESAERLQLDRTLVERAEYRKKMNCDSLTHRPEFVVKPRGQTVWEGKNLKLHCTLTGWPNPRVNWYKNNIVIDAKAHSEKYTTESNYNMHSLEIKNCDFFDTAKYHASALNIKGESSSVASIVIKNGFCAEHGVTFESAILDKFTVAFGCEGETLSLGCTVIVFPTIKNYQPDVVWYRDFVQRATLTLIHLNKEDEGMYTMRVNTKSGFNSYSAYVFVRDAEVEAEGVPVAPLDVRCHDANKDYVVVTWKQPAVEGSSSILGYYVDKCEVGTQHWSQCNDSPVKYARFPVTGLVEGRSYVFRVPGPSAPWTGIIRFTEEDTTVGVVPGEASEVVVTEATKSYVVLGWKPPVQRGHEGVMYYIEKCISGTEQWQRVNTGMPVKSPRYALFDLAEHESYSFRVRCCNSAGHHRGRQAGNCATSIVVSWGASKEIKELVGYYIEYSVVGSEAWVPSNNKPVKSTRFVCHGLTTGETYVFKVKAVNAAGYSNSSPLSDAVLVKPAVEAAKDYMVLSWSAPADNGGADITGYYLDYRTVKGEVAGKWLELNPKAVNTTSYKAEGLKENLFYQFQGMDHHCTSGRSPVNGYYLDIKEAGEGGTWRGVHEKVNQLKYMKVTGLNAGASYEFRLRAQNLAGVGNASGVFGPVLAQTRPGAHEIKVDVDDDGVISMMFQCSEMTQSSEFIWSKNYKAITDSSRITVVTKGGMSRAIFNNPSLEDLGTFSCMVTNTEGISASYTLTEEALNRLLDISHEHKFPEGDVEKCTSACTVEYVFNDTLIAHGKKYSMNYDQQTGIIEMFMDSLEVTDEGTYTFNLVDGKAKGTTSLVLIGDEFRELQKKSEFERAEWVRKQGPHFVEYLSFTVTLECDVLLTCKIGNIKADTEITWSKDKLDIHAEDDDAKKIGMKDGVLTFNIGKCVTKQEKEQADIEQAEQKRPAVDLPPEPPRPKMSKRDAGVYEVELRDARGKDNSTFNMTDAGYQAVLNEVFRVIANSSTSIQVLSTEHGIVLYSNVSYYTDELRVGWLHKESKITSSARLVSGVTEQQLWLKVNEPTEKDKGKYTMDIFDGKDGLKRVFELSGQAWQEAFEEFQRLKAAAIAERNRARSLNLTGNVWGDPAPQVSWLKNDRELVADSRYTLKFEHGKYASITILGVTTADSGKYALLVQNKYGTETGDFTVSVYIPDEDEKKE
ncbi:hypothetical protein NHX12_003979 [Muraenolepis orangiensis]|uniref:Myomesin n=1 Tax=Muraenolepis orangiensis TaxID=630683 RepID=A0A9Q0IBR6_9TELE|nr:hypothetical protein NHX12_003979 [Muraenolepis orangiensis]